MGKPLRGFVVGFRNYIPVGGIQRIRLSYIPMVEAFCLRFEMLQIIDVILLVYMGIKVLVGIFEL